jgi:fumarate hydratase subunit beta
MKELKITSPLTDDIIANLKAGQKVLLSGTIYTARDAAHRRIYNAAKNGEDPGFDMSGKTIYYAGPCPAKPGYPIGPIGPTTSGRMDFYTPFLLDNGLKAMIGKGIRSKEVKESIMKNRAIYFAAVGGAAVVYMNCVKTAEIYAFEDLGTEAIRKLDVEKMPLIVALDIYGGDVYG